MSTDSSTASNEALPTASVRGSVASWLRSLSLVEKVSWILIVLGISGFALLVFLPALLKTPESTRLQVAEDFPMRGAHVEVKAAEAFWREPESEEVRSEMAAQPVLQLQLSGNGVVRVLFRDGSGRLTGDPVTLEVDGHQEVAVSCTAGLATTGEFSGYHAGEIKPWTVELLEAAAGAEDPNDFSKLFQMSLPATLK